MAEQLAHVAEPIEAELPFRFHGNTAEYFRIWIVNLCLTVVTLGIYAPWAKVRTRRYFAANLEVGGSAFDYDANPVRILVGRLIVLAAFAAYALADLFFQPVSLALGAAYFLLYPAAAVRSTAFHHRHTLFRGVRFGFAARYGEAFFVLVLAPVLGVLTLGLAMPWWNARYHAFVARNSRYGASPFGFEQRTSAYYRLFGRAGLAWLGVSFLTGIAILVASGGPQIPRTIVALAIVPLLVGLGLAVAILEAGLGNLLYHGAQVGELRFRSRLRARPLAWLYATSLVAVIATLGLATPWARVRLARYRADSLTLVAPSGLDAFAQASEPAGGLGEIASEAADFFDFDLGL